MSLQADTLFHFGFHLMGEGFEAVFVVLLGAVYLISRISKFTTTCFQAFFQYNLAFFDWRRTR